MYLGTGLLTKDYTLMTTKTTFKYILHLKGCIFGILHYKSLKTKICTLSCKNIANYSFKARNRNKLVAFLK